MGLRLSRRAFRLPGWALVSTHGSDPAYACVEDQVLALELKPGGRIVRLAHTRSLVDENPEQDYWAEPHGGANADFTGVPFTTVWGRSRTGAAEMFMIELPSDSIKQLP
jgi:hypothetical protein